MAHVILSLDCGGLERVVVDLVRTSVEARQQVSVVCLERLGALAADVKALGVPVECFDKPPGIRLGLVKRLSRHFREIRPDVVHTHQIGALFYAGPAARRAGVPAVLHTEHGKHYGQRRQTRWLGRLAARYADRFCCVSSDIADAVKTYRIASDEKVAIVPNGIDVERFRRPCDAEEVRKQFNIPADAFVIGTIGRLAEVKRQDRLIRAFAELQRHVPNSRLLIVGDGPLRGELESLASELGIARYVHFVGYQAQRENYLQAMNVFALTSRSEGMPLVVLEAWAAGVPVVASAVGGLPEMIEHGRTGFLFQSDQIDELDLQLAQLCSDCGASQRIALAAQQKVVTDFGLERMAARYYEQYAEILGAKTAGN